MMRLCPTKGKDIPKNSRWVQHPPTDKYLKTGLSRTLIQSTASSGTSTATGSIEVISTRYSTNSKWIF